jgi:hypothetical protein
LSLFLAFNPLHLQLKLLFSLLCLQLLFFELLLHKSLLLCVHLLLMLELELKLTCMGLLLTGLGFKLLGLLLE